MVETYNLSSNSSGCHSEVNCTCCDEPTYVNERHLIFLNDENDVSRRHQPLYQYPMRKRWKAAVTIQRAYRLFLRRRMRFELLQDERDEANNYIEFWDESNINRRSEYSLITTSNSASDSKNSDFDNDIDRHDGDENSDEQYHNDHIYDSIPYDFLSQSPSESPNNRFLQHHSQCPLSNQQRKHSIDPARLSHRELFAHRHSEQFSPHSVLIYDNDNRTVNANLLVVGSPEPQPILMTITKNCPTHKMYHSNSMLCPNCPNNVSANSHLTSLDDKRISRQPDEHSRRSLLQKQSKIIQNQKVLTNKRMYRVGLNIFNKNPAAGISYLIKNQYLIANPSQIAKFLLTKGGISRNAIGDYIGSIGDQLALQVTKYFLRRINMKNKEVDEALRSFIFYVHLPGESQKICHLMEEFKEAYLQQNELRPQFKSKDTVMILAYAIIMLQTDAHNQSIRKNEKMTQEQFVTNLRGVDDNCDIDRSVLERIYKRVSSDEMKTQPDHSDQVRRWNDSISSGNKPPDFVNRVRRFMCYCRLSEVVDESKKSKSDAHKRDVFLFNDILLITKSNNKSRKEDVQYHCKYALPLADLRVKVFNSTNNFHGIQILDRNTNESIIKLNARCAEDQKRFMFDLSDCIFESLETLKVNCTDLLTLSFSQTQNSPKNIPNHLASKCQCILSNKMEKLLPHPPRRQESLIRNGAVREPVARAHKVFFADRLDVVQPVFRVRNKSCTESDNTR